jgi:protein-L-isoaspartate O-methyltransferase
MLASLDPQPGHAVLEIGSGSGYNTALLCERVGESNVVSVEVDRDLTISARRRLGAAGYTPEVVHADGEAGYPPRATYDRLISTASVRRVPHAWLEQMKPDGEIVTPWLPNERALGLIWLRMREPGVAGGWFHGAETFMPVRGQRRERTDLTTLWNATHTDAEASEEAHDLADLDDVHGEFALAALLPGVTCYRQTRGWFFLSENRRSWARIDGKTVHRYGDRDLIRDVRAASHWWRDRERPRLFDFGLTVTPEEQTVWLLSPENPVPRW